jgi:DNA polymerase-1
MGNLFDLIPSNAQVANDDWRPEPPPSLDGIQTIYLNFETTGLKWFDNDLPISCSLFAGDRSWYLPWGHIGAGNLDENLMRGWAQRELRDKHICNINTRFDIHFARVWGVDLVEQGNTFSDVSHFAALLDDHRKEMKLDVLIPDYLGETPMARLDESRMRSYSAGAAAPRSRYNVEAVKRLRDVMWPKLEAEGLLKVIQLENEVIPVVCEMEKNGTRIDIEKLNLWLKEVREKYHRALMDLYKETGLKLNPNASRDAGRLFDYLNIPHVELTEHGAPSFTDAVIKSVQHPTVQRFRHAKKYASIISKLEKYQRCVGSDGILRYALHQLRASKDDSEYGGETGTVVGRFTSTEIVRGVGINIQQVLKPEKQFLAYGDEYFIRELHIPDEGNIHFSCDAEQIQYRLFAHEANNPEVLDAYKKDPWVSFHKMMLKKLHKQKPDLSYKRCKDVNFAKMFAAGPTKLALMLEFITKKEFDEIRAQKNWRHPKLAPVYEILGIYKQEMPEVDQLLEQASKLAETRGYIKSILGRRLRFPNGERLHKALNARIISSEADIVKTKGVELFKVRKELGIKLRFQVHDEYDGDAPDRVTALKVADVLNTQSFELRVPILWGLNTGSSWGACAADELRKLREAASS